LARGPIIKRYRFKGKGVKFRGSEMRSPPSGEKAPKGAEATRTTFPHRARKSALRSEVVERRQR